MIGAGQNRFMAVGNDGLGDLLVPGGNDGPADTAFFGPPGNLHDHRNTANFGEWLSGKPGRGHAGRNEDEIGHIHRLPELLISG